MMPDEPSVTAIHEAGHIVSRFDAAAAMGREPHSCVHYVEMWEGVYGRTSGPFFSAEIERHEAAAIAALLELSPEEIEQQGRSRIVETARTAGADIGAWVDAKLLEMIGGATAEAKATRVGLVLIVLDRPECAHDRADIAGIVRLAGLSDQECREAVGRGITRLRELWSDERKWAALVELAKALPKTGRLDGMRCWEIYSTALDCVGLRRSG